MSTPSKTTTALGTKTLAFDVLDLRGRQGFPRDPRGFVYLHREDRELPQRYTGLTRRQRRTWAVRHGGQEEAWRVDLHSGFGLWEVGVAATWAGPEQAALALEGRLAAQVTWEG